MDWSLFWNAVGGIAQAAAAVATFLAVFVALRLGKREDQRTLQVRYDDARPVLIIVSDSQDIPLQQGNERYLDWNNQPPTIELQNVGNGPALNVKSVIYGPEARADSVPSDPDASSSSRIWKPLDNEEEKKEKEKHWYHWAASVVRPGKQEKLQYALAADLIPIQFSQASKSIRPKSGIHPYPFNAPKQPLSSPNQGEPWHLCRVTITYQDIFHRKHASVYDLIFQQGWQAVALIDDIVNDLGDLVRRETS